MGYWLHDKSHDLDRPHRPMRVQWVSVFGYAATHWQLRELAKEHRRLHEVDPVPKPAPQLNSRGRRDAARAAAYRKRKMA